VTQPGLRAVVEAKLALGWSPQQITGWLPLAYPQDPVMRVSHETIYLSLFVQGRGALRRELQRCLRSGRAMRYPRAKRLPQGRGQLRDTIHISQRPPEAADRAVPGHWEGDPVFGKRPARWEPWLNVTAAMCCCSRSLTGSLASACGRR
jgi:IS30 family transposase